MTLAPRLGLPPAAGAGAGTGAGAATGAKAGASRGASPDSLRLNEASAASRTLSGVLTGGSGGLGS